MISLSFAPKIAQARHFALTPNQFSQLQQVSDNRRPSDICISKSSRDHLFSSTTNLFQQQNRSQAMSRGGKLAPEVNRYVETLCVPR